MPDRSSAEPGRGEVRTAVVWDAVRGAISGLESEHSGPLEVVDLGGGTGGFAVRVAALGHRVTVVDPSPDALASLHRRAVEHAVDDRVHAVQGDATDLGEHVDAGTAHLVLCHGVLEVVDDPAIALRATHHALRPGGIASVLVSGRLAAVLARALAGDFTRARTMFASTAAEWDVRADGPRRFTQDEIAELVVANGFTLEGVDAIRVFSDLVPSALVDTESGARGALLELERAVASSPEFLTVASQLHLLARR